MNEKAQRRVAEIVVPLACLAVVAIGYALSSQRDPDPDPAPTPAPRQVEVVSVPPPAAAPPADTGPGPISKAAVVAGMNGVKPAIADCYTRYQVPGMAMAHVVIGRDGKISRAAVTGRFQGTPTGACVEAAVRTATFPPSDGLATPYPFMLK